LRRWIFAFFKFDHGLILFYKGIENLFPMRMRKADGKPVVVERGNSGKDGYR